MSLRLMLRTPQGLLCDREVLSVCAEDEAGWFGILPGRQDVIACLPPGLLTFRDADGEMFVALSSGLLELRGAICRVIVRDARWSRSLDDVAAALARALQTRKTRGQRRSGVFADLEREALRRLGAEQRT